MLPLQAKTMKRITRGAAIAVAALLLSTPYSALAKDKKKNQAPAEKPKPHWLDTLDYSKIVWPNPPAIARIKYSSYFSGEKLDPTKKPEKKKLSWKEKLAGVAAGEPPKSETPRYQLVMPYGLAVDSKGRLYIADRKVSAVFIVSPDTGAFEMIKNGVHARFGAIIGLAIDDADRLFVSDAATGCVLVFNPRHEAEASITQGLVAPSGLAVDNENRLLYVADPEQDQVIVFDADPPYKQVRRIGTGGKKHTLTTPGDFAMPSNVAVDQDGNLYVSDTLNNRVQIFDAEGNFIRTFGKAGDGPGYFARPKGIAMDGDGHVWVADAVQNRVQVFDQEGRLLIYMGGTGILPGQFRTLAGLAIDKNNRVFTSEQFPGRVQVFRYVNDEEAKAEKERREASEAAKSAASAQAPK